MSEATMLEGVLKRDRTIILAALADLSALAWADIIALAWRMRRMQAWGAPRSSSPGSCGP
jgi:predicted metal-binding membrane protein